MIEFIPQENTLVPMIHKLRVDGATVAYAWCVTGKYGTDKPLEIDCLLFLVFDRYGDEAKAIVSEVIEQINHEHARVDMFLRTVSLDSEVVYKTGTRFMWQYETEYL